MIRHRVLPGLWGKRALCALLLVFSTASFAGKPAVVIFSDVEITFAGQTFGFSGLEKSFSQSSTGGRIVFDVTQLSTPDYAPLPQIDTSVLDPTFNHWEIQTNVKARTYTYSGTCATQTFTTIDSGFVVHHLYLNCRDLSVL